MDESDASYESYNLKSWLDLPESSNWIEVLDPKAHILAYWDQRARPDGRMFSQARPTQIASSLLKHSAGSALVKQGDTKVMTAIGIEIGQPAPEFPDHGDVLVSVTGTSSPSSSSATRPRFYDRLQAWLQRMLDDLLPPHLNLLTGKACIRLIVSTVILQDAGNLRDASLLSCMAAWKDTALPTMDHLKESEGGRLWWKEGPVSSVSTDATAEPPSSSSGSDGRNDNNNNNKGYRISLTMGIFRDAKSKEVEFAVDPSAEEAEFCDGEMTLVMDLPSRKIQVEYAGSAGLEASDFALATKLANGRADELEPSLL